LSPYVATVPRNVHAETTTVRNVTSYSNRIRALALSLPATYEDAPWGFPVFKVADNKLFAMMTDRDDECEVTVKVTDEERDVALQLPHVRRASYVGRYGWITARVADEESLQSALEWVRESYWLRAPKRLRDRAFDE
jgi:predicted DNA-binding protein (MmcQ/YjbR family)